MFTLALENDVTTDWVTEKVADQGHSCTVGGHDIDGALMGGMPCFTLASPALLFSLRCTRLY